MYNHETNRERDANVDLLKIFACIGVVGLHTLGSFELICGFSVPTFLLCTGFLLAKRKKTTIQKTWSRLLRLLKTVVLWSFLYLSFPRVFVNSPGWDECYPLTLLQTVGNAFIQRGMWQFWYFGALGLLYILVQFADWVLPKVRIDRNRLKLTLWGLLLVFGAVLQIISYYYLHYPAQSIYIQTFRLWTWIQYYLMGNYLFHMKERLFIIIPQKLDTIILILLTAAAWLVQCGAGKWLIDNLHTEYFYDDLVVAAWVFCFALFILRLDVERFRWGITEVSKLTLGVYILHPFILEWVLSHFSIVTVPQHILLFVSLTALSFLLSFLLNKVPVLRDFVRL